MAIALYQPLAAAAERQAPVVSGAPEVMVMPQVLARTLTAAAEAAAERQATTGCKVGLTAGAAGTAPEGLVVVPEEAVAGAEQTEPQELAAAEAAVKLA